MEVQRIIASSNSHQGVGPNQGFAEPKEVHTCTQIFQTTNIIESANTALTTFREISTALLLQNTSMIDPREQIIEELEDQNQLLITEMIKAAQVYDENQAEKNKTIASQAKCIEELSAGHIQDQAHIKEVSLLLEAQSKAHQEDKDRRTTILNQEMNAIFEISQSIKSFQKNLPLIKEYQFYYGYASSPHTSGRFGIFQGPKYYGTAGQIAANILSQIDKEYQDRVNLTMEALSEEMIIKMTSIEDRLKTIQNTFGGS